MSRSDAFFSEHPFAAGIAEKRIRAAFSMGMGENIAVHAAAAVACALLSVSAPFEWLYYLSFAVMLAVWVSCSLLAGFRRHWIYPVYSAAVRLLPLLLLSEKNTQTGAFDELLRTLCATVSDYVFSPFYSIGFDRKTICGLVLAIELAIFVRGIFLRKSAKQSKLYCSVRIKLLQHSSRESE